MLKYAASLPKYPERINGVPVSRRIDVSGDGQQVLAYCLDAAMNHWRPAILSTEPGKPVSFFDLPSTSGSLQWMPDGKAIAYIDTRQHVSNIWVLPFQSRKPYQLTHFDSELIANLRWSKDGKDLALVRGQDLGDWRLIGHGEETSRIILAGASPVSLQV